LLCENPRPSDGTLKEEDIGRGVMRFNVCSTIYQDEDSNCLVVKEENEIIGFVQWTEKRTPEIIYIMVLPERQNKGYGKEILNQILTGLRSKRFRKVRLGVFKSNLTAGHLYEKIGFKPIQMIIAMFWVRNE